MKTYFAPLARMSTFAAAVVVALLVTTPLRAERPERNIVFFITDDESPTLGCYGDKAAKTPAIDAIAADGTRFNNAFATTASCSASRSVVLTGLHNHMNGQYGHTHHYHKFSSYHDVVQLALPRLLEGAGYRTARCGKYHVAPEAVFHFETVIPGDSRSDVQMAENCREFLTKEDDRPFFLYFALSDPHRGGPEDQNSKSEFKPNLFGNKPNRGSYPGVHEVFYDPADVVVPSFLPDTQETREELAQYYQACARIDQGLAHLVRILKDADVYDKTLIVFTADHGMAFAGGKTTVYEPGLRVPFIVRDPYLERRGVVSDAMISHVDITPSLLDFAGALDREKNAPKRPINANKFWKERGEALAENRNGGNKFDVYHGKSWIPILDKPDAEHHKSISASHTFHEIQMYYPMRVYRDKQYKLIWNIAYKLDYPFASDLWAASSWQAQWKKGLDAPYGKKTVGEYIQRPEFEFYDMERDPNETKNLAGDPAYASTLEEYKAKLKADQKRLHDPWVMKWDYQ
ncbi:sulfatase [Blastopirellula sp. JC732]|uniref:Sulfatase n=1 Tax=Blastopirellula sediminis TaxID=2894196 RepID=A0A9X1SGV1_9BACT|nr:sulfatase [Blastopirellula sediminis]MCC9607325.1 sulfatase [Blastopirellula sediminis]MCC9629382.1 sulfatase [Blastopirellula sediminis]